MAIWQLYTCKVALIAESAAIHPPAASSRTEGVPARLKRQDRLFAKNLITEEEFKVAPPGFSPNCS